MYAVLATIILAQTEMKKEIRVVYNRKKCYIRIEENKSRR